MQINTSYNHNFSNYPKPQTLEELDKPTSTPQTQFSKPKEDLQDSLPPLGELKRETYGLTILELMSDDEYRAFLRATSSMTESQKIMAAQSLYRLSELYQGKQTPQSSSTNPYLDESFISIYKNAYQSILAYKTH